MPVDSRTVNGRRQLRFGSLDEVVADAERLAASQYTRMLGNWSLGRLLAHLAKAIDYSLAGEGFLVPWWIRFFASFRKQRYLAEGLPAGFQLPREKETKAFPDATPEEGLAALRQAVSRAKAGTMSVPHPVFGKLTHQEWIQLHLRHAELHLSYAVES